MAWAIVVLCVAFVAWLVVAEVDATVGPDEARTERSNAAVLVIDHDGYRYAYHAVTGAEALFDLTRDPERLVNLLSERPHMGRRFRDMLKIKERVADLRDLQGRYRGEIDDLRALGYL